MNQILFFDSTQLDSTRLDSGPVSGPALPPVFVPVSVPIPMPYTYTCRPELILSLSTTIREIDSLPFPAFQSLAFHSILCLSIRLYLSICLSVYYLWPSLSISVCLSLSISLSLSTVHDPRSTSHPLRYSSL